MSVVTLIVGYILYTVDPPQMPVLPLVLFLTMHTFSPFLAQISSLTQLYDSRPFTLVFALTRLFKYFLSSPKFFWHQLFYYFLIQLFFFFTCFFPLLFPILWFFPHKGGHLVIFTFSSSSQFWGYVLLAMVFPRLPPSFLDHIHSSLLVPHVPCNTSCILSYILPFFHYCLFYLYF